MQLAVKYAIVVHLSDGACSPHPDDQPCSLHNYLLNMLKYSWHTFCWQAAKYAFKFISAMVLVRLFQYCLNDTSIGMVAAVSGVLGNMVMAYAFNSEMLWMGK